MPNLYSSKCTKCDFETSTSSGGQLYVLNESGKKVVCPHPLEDLTVAEVLKISRAEVFAWFKKENEKIPAETKKKIEDNIGMDFQYICLDCYTENFLDINRDELKCTQCGSTNLKYVAKLVNQPCPKCKVGTIEMISKGIS